MRTFKEIFKELPKGIRERAITNTDTLNQYITSKTKVSVDSLELALKMAFPWEESPEGAQFWVIICDIFRNK